MKILLSKDTLGSFVVIKLPSFILLKLIPSLMAQNWMNSTLQHNTTLRAKSNANISFTVSIIFRLYPQYDAPILQLCEPAAATRLQLHCQLLLVALDVGT